LLNLAALVALVTIIGCDRPEVRTYNAPKEKPAAPAAAAANAKIEVDGIRMAVPADWKKIDNSAAANQMFANSRLIGFNIASDDGEAQMTVTRINGGGTKLDNVIRWRRQLGMPPVESVNDSEFSKVKIGGQEAELFTLTGEQKSMLAAYLTRSGSMITFKLSGDSKAVEAQKAAFADFLQTVEFTK
jgi:hypothetical protein